MSESTRNQQPREFKNHATRMIELYGGFRQKFVMTTRYTQKDGTESVSVFIPKWKGNPLAVRVSSIEHHLAGDYTVGLYSFPNETIFTSFDVDQDDWTLVDCCVAALEEMGFNAEDIHVSKSGKKGYHIDLFYGDWIYLTEQDVIYEALLRKTGAAKWQIEMRPTDKQSIKLPLGVHQATGNRCWFVDKATGKEIETFDYIFGIKQINIDEVREIIRRTRKENEEEREAEERDEERAQKKNKREVEYTLDSTDLPVLKHEHTRHDTMLSIAVVSRKRGKERDEISGMLKEWYKAQDQSLIHSSTSAVMTDINDICNWVMANIDVIPEMNKPVFKKAEICKITIDDVEHILALRGAVPHAIYFIVTVLQQTRKDVKFTGESFETMTTFDCSSIYNALRKMSEVKAIEWLKGEIHSDGKMCRADKSTYRILDTAPSVAIPEEVILQNEALLDHEELFGDFWHCYFQTLFSLVDEKWLMKKLSGREREILHEVRKREQLFA